MPLVDRSATRRIVTSNVDVVRRESAATGTPTPHWDLAPLDRSSLPQSGVPRGTTLHALAKTPREKKIEAAAAMVTKASMLETLTALCKDPVMGPREASTPEYLVAADYVAKKLADMGVEPLGDVKNGARTFLQHFEWKERYAPGVSQSANVVGIIRGNGPEPRKAVVLSAHLDNLSKGEKEDYARRDGRDLSHYEGANDNTASVAIVLDTVKALAATGPYAHDVIVLISSAEEDYLMGAAAFVQSPPVPLDRIAANVNLEMPGHGNTDDVYVYGGTGASQQTSNALYARAMRVTKDAKVPLKDGLTIDAGERWFERQDGLVFTNVGIPNILLQGGAAEGHYHTDTDTVEDLNMDKVEVLGRHTARIMADLLDDPAPGTRRASRGSANPSGRYVKATGG